MWVLAEDSLSMTVSLVSEEKVSDWGWQTVTCILSNLLAVCAASFLSNPAMDQSHGEQGQQRAGGGVGSEAVGFMGRRMSMSFTDVSLFMAFLWVATVSFTPLKAGGCCSVVALSMCLMGLVARRWED